MAPARRRIPYDEYLAIERELDVKHDYIDGEIVAMAGGTPTHAALCAAVVAALGHRPADGRCRTFSSNLKIYVASRNRATYADVAVICGPTTTAVQDRNAATNPTLLVEVLSDSTEAEDRGTKFAAYGTLESLREYVLVSQHEPIVEVFRRNDNGTWTLQRHGAGETVTLPSVSASFTVDGLYAGIELEPPPPRRWPAPA